MGKFIFKHVFLRILDSCLGILYHHVTLRPISYIWLFALQCKRQILHCLLIKEKVTAKTAYF